MLFNMYGYLDHLNLFNDSYISGVLSGSKVWGRIKGFFKKAWKFIKGVSPVVAKIGNAVSDVLPGPYGAAIAGVTNAIDTIASTVSVTAVGGVVNS